MDSPKRKPSVYDCNQSGEIREARIEQTRRFEKYSQYEKSDDKYQVESPVKGQQPQQNSSSLLQYYQ